MYDEDEDDQDHFSTTQLYTTFRRQTSLPRRRSAASLPVR